MSCCLYLSLLMPSMCRTVDLKLLVVFSELTGSMVFKYGSQGPTSGPSETERAEPGSALSITSSSGSDGTCLKAHFEEPLHKKAPQSF